MLTLSDEQARKAVTELRQLFGTVIMEAPEYVPSVEDGLAVLRKLAESAPQEAEQVFSEAYRIASTFPSIPHDREFARFLFDAGWRFRNDKAVLQEAGARDELVIEICRELYDRFMMGGWEPKDAHRWLQELLASRSRMDRNQLAKILWDSEITEANYRGEKKDYWAQWPEDFEKQPYCRSTLRQAEFIINKLSPWRRKSE